MTTLICDSDSWGWGSELRDPTLGSEKDDSSPDNDRYRLSKVWPTLLGQKLDARVVNLAQVASANTAILLRTTNYLLANYVEPDLPRDDVVVVVGWSSPERRTFWYRDDKQSRRMTVWTKWAAKYDTFGERKFAEHYVAFFDNPEDYLLETVLCAFQLQEFCKKFGFRFVQYNSFYHNHAVLKHWKSPPIQKMLSELGPDFFTSWNDGTFERHYLKFDLYTKLLDRETYLGLDTGETFKSFIDDSVGDIGYYGYHPSVLGHQTWANRLYEYLKENHGLA